MYTGNFSDIKKSFGNKDLIHVFFITSPIVSGISSMIIEKYKLSKHNIVTVSFRKTNLDLFDNKKIYIKTSRLIILIEKILFISFNAIKILRIIKKHNKNFVVYTPWAFRELKFLIKNNNCHGYFYIEEGQLAYLSNDVFNYNSLPFFQKIRLNFMNRIPLSLRLRDDAIAFFSINKNAFKNISNKKIIILNNFDLLKKKYKQKLRGLNNIGLTCASRRIKTKQLPAMLEKLISQMPDGGIIKPHPSFYATEKMKENFVIAFNKVKKPNIQLSPNNIIIEIEMLYEKKNLIGPQSSLSIYAELFGSKYKSISLY